MAATSPSRHPVMHDRSSTLPQTSLLTQMLKLDGTASTRGMGTRILCTDCHNSDDNREFGGAGANGPHGSKYNHVLERRFDMSQASTAGGLMTNAAPNPDLTNNGPYAMCAKCHDLALVLSTGTVHQKHVNEVGASCSVCHTSHGIGTPSATITGQRLVNFDAGVAGPNGTAPVTFDGATRSCTLTCHAKAHDKSVY